MNNQRPVWQRVFIFLFLGLTAIVVPWVLPGKIPSMVLWISVLLGSYLILEALAQPDPSVHKTPLYHLIGRYTNQRDRFVASISFGVLILALLLSGILLEDMESINWMVKTILSLLLAVGSYFAVGFYFGSQELRDTLIPKILKRLWEKRNQDAK